MFQCGICDNKSYSSQKALNKHDRQVHNVVIVKEVLYDCQFEECNETFPSKRKLQEHHSRNHKTLRTELFQMFKCDACDNKIYSSQKALNRHDRQVHSVFKEVLYDCQFEECNETFPSKRKLQEHHSRNHKTLRTSGSTFQCHKCGKLYSSRSYLRKHANKHSTQNFHIEQNDKYECFTCGSFFETKNVCDHVKLHSRHKNLLCPFNECKDSYNRYIHLRRHISDDHNIHLTTETYSFKTKNEFNEWRSAKEQELKASYVKNTSEKKLKDGVTKTYFHCHRSLAPRITETPKSNVKIMGTNKTGRACPSTMIVTYNQQCLSVVLYPVHIGHCNELGRLRISETDRLKIAGKLSQGVTVDRVLSDIRESVPNGEVERIHLVEKKDINNIIRDFSIGYSTKRPKNDAVSVKSNSLNSKLEIIMGLNNNLKLGVDHENTISKHLDKVIDIYNANSQTTFEVKETVTTTQEIEPQLRMFSAKCKRKPQEDTQQPSETKNIKLALKHPEAKVPYISTDFNFDHSYSRQ